MGHLVEWSWIVARRGIDVADWFRREGVDTYEKAQNLASKSGFTSPTREQFEKAIAGPEWFKVLLLILLPLPVILVLSLKKEEEIQRKKELLRAQLQQLKRLKSRKK